MVIEFLRCCLVYFALQSNKPIYKNVLLLEKWGFVSTDHPMITELLRQAKTRVNIELRVAESLNSKSALFLLICIKRHTAKLWCLHQTSDPFNFTLYCKSSGKFYISVELHIYSSWNMWRRICITRCRKWIGKIQFISISKSWVSLTRLNTTLKVAAIKSLGVIPNGRPPLKPSKRQSPAVFLKTTLAAKCRACNTPIFIC